MIEGRRGAGEDSSTSVEFRDAQQLDIRVWDRNNAQAWQWSAGQLFAQSLATRTLVAGDSVTDVAHCKPSAPAAYHAMGYFTSSSHGAVRFRTVSSP